MIHFKLLNLPGKELLAPYKDRHGFLPEPGDDHSDFNFPDREFDDDTWANFVTECTQHSKTVMEAHVLNIKRIHAQLDKAYPLS